MPSPEVFIQGLILRHEYNAADAHAYYLRTRDLKGRSRGMDGDGAVGPPPAAQPAKPNNFSTQPVKKTGPVLKKAVPVVKKTAEQRRKEIEAATEVLKSKLDGLRKILAELVKQARVRSGVESPSPESKPADTKTPAPTPKDKADEAKKAHDYYEQHKNDTPEESVAALQTKIKAVEAKIRELRDKIAKQNTISTTVRKAVPVGAGSKPK
jgi:prefoldin subunit 5